MMAKTGTLMGVFLLIGLVFFLGCSKEEEPPAGPADSSDVPGAPGEAKSPAIRETIPALVRPDTADALALMPEETAMALAFPSLRSVYDKGVALAKRIAPEEADLDALLRQNAQEMGKQLNVPDANSVLDVALAKGIDPDAPVALFIDGDSLAKFMEVSAQAMVPPGQTPEGAMPPNPMAAAMMAPPAVALVLGCADRARVEATLAETMASPGGQMPPAQTVEVEGVKIVSHAPMPFAYFLTENRLALSSSVDLLRGVAARLKNPASIRYGSADCPAAAPDEIVSLLRMDKLMPLITTLSALGAQGDPMAAAFSAIQARAMAQTAEAYAGDDPMVVTIEWTPERIDILTRIGLDTHPGVMALTGEPALLRQAGLLPAHTLAMASVRLTPEAKKQMTETWGSALPQEAGADLVAGQAAGMLSFASGLIGEEVTIGVMGVREGLPKLLLMLQLADAEQTKNLLQMVGLELKPTETYNGIDIGTPGLELPLPVHAAFAEDMLILATDPQEIKGVIDQFTKEGEAPFLRALEPPLDPGVPRYSAFVAKNEVLTEVIQPLLLPPGMPTEAVPPPLETASALLDQVQSTQEIVGNWQQSRVTVYFKGE